MGLWCGNLCKGWYKEPMNLLSSWRWTTQPLPELGVLRRTTRTPQSSSQSARLRADHEGVATKLKSLFCWISKFFCSLPVRVELYHIFRRNKYSQGNRDSICDQNLQSIYNVSIFCLFSEPSSSKKVNKSDLSSTVHWVQYDAFQWWSEKKKSLAVRNAWVQFSCIWQGNHRS